MMTNSYEAAEEKKAKSPAVDDAIEIMARALYGALQETAPPAYMDDFPSGATIDSIHSYDIAEDGRTLVVMCECTDGRTLVASFAPGCAPSMSMHPADPAEGVG